MSVLYGLGGLAAGAALGLGAGSLLAIPLAADVRHPRSLILGCTLAFAALGTLAGWRLSRA
ncbi:hypothetical protein BH18CHL2_BH18CHL2_05040 [soil metagenome]